MADVFFIVGEPSGDALGAALIGALKDREILSIEGIGGDLMQAQGLETLLPMDELCVMGLWEVVSHLPRLLKLIQAVTEEIEKRQPRILITIDLPDFNFRVAQLLKKRGIFKGKIVHYVAPSVWAWRPGRAKKIAAFLDGLMCLFPFEPPYFTKEGLKAGFVGHPLVEMDKAKLDPLGFRAARGIPANALVLGVFFGSREAELKALGPIFIQTIEALAEQYPDIHIVCPSLPQLEMEVTNLVRDLRVHTSVVVDVAQKWNAMAACNLALAASGTVGLELSYIATAHVIAYKPHPVTAAIIKALAKVKYAHLGNILLDRAAVPEFLQGKCNPYDITAGLMRLIRYEEDRAKQAQAFEEIFEKVSPKAQNKPSAQAAAFIFDILSSKTA
jgi:lipid-A-disaccharide synthase